MTKKGKKGMFSPSVMCADQFPGRRSPYAGSRTRNQPMRPGDWYQQYQQQQQEDDKTRYEPSQSLRDHITLRMQKQLDCLNKAHNRLMLLMQEAEAGRQAGAQGPGDQQISAQQAKNAAQSTQGAVSGPMMGAMGNMPTYSPPMRYMQGVPSPMTTPRMSSRGGPISSYWPATMPTNYQNGGKSLKAKDPIERYHQLEAEIGGLMSLADRSAWIAIHAPGKNGIYDPVKAKKKVLEEILGPPRADSSDEDSDEDGNRGIAAPAEQQQPLMIESAPVNTAPPPPPPPVPQPPPQPIMQQVQVPIPPQPGPPPMQQYGQGPLPPMDQGLQPNMQPVDPNMPQFAGPPPPQHFAQPQQPIMQDPVLQPPGGYFDPQQQQQQG